MIVHCPSCGIGIDADADAELAMAAACEDRDAALRDLDAVRAELAAIKARRCGTCANFDHGPHLNADGYDPLNLNRGQGWCETFNVPTYAVMSCPDWKGGE